MKLFKLFKRKKRKDYKVKSFYTEDHSQEYRNVDQKYYQKREQYEALTDQEKASANGRALLEGLNALSAQIDAIAAKDELKNNHNN